MWYNKRVKDAPYKNEDTQKSVSSQAENTLFLVFVERMESIRTKKGLSNADIARALGISNQSFQKYKSDRVPGSEYLYKISHVLGVTMNWLLGDGDINHPAYLHEQGSVAQADHKAIQKALNLISQANAVLTDYISK